MFTVSKKTMERKLKEYTKKIPKPLNRQFPERLSKAAAIEKKKQRDEIVSKLIPPGTLNLSNNSHFSITTYLLVYVLLFVIFVLYFCSML